jgi:flagellar biosynthesis anti-sigma factor FlgM
MRIHDAYTGLNGPTRSGGASATGEVGKGAKEGAARAADAASSTNVKLSAKAVALADLADPGSAKIDALRERVRNGTLRVDAHAIASKLLGGDS